MVARQIRNLPLGALVDPPEYLKILKQYLEHGNVARIAREMRVHRYYVSHALQSLGVTRPDEVPAMMALLESVSATNLELWPQGGGQIPVLAELGRGWKLVPPS